MHEIYGPLPKHAQANADKWCTTTESANQERDTHSRIAASCSITGDEYPRQGLTHAWNAVAAHRAWYELHYAA